MALDATDGAILRRLSGGPVPFETLAGSVDESDARLRERLARLRDDGLVDVAGADGAFTLTREGHRVVAAPGNGTADDRIDTPPAVERAIEDADLGPDEAAALRAVYVFLAFWGDATAAEIGDAIFAAHPAGHGSATTWWTEVVAPRLPLLPGIEPPTDGRYWRYAGEAEAAAVEDGRHVAGPAAVGSVRHGVDHLEGPSEERSAVRAAFAALYEAGELTREALEGDLFPRHPAGYDTVEDWWDGAVREGLASLPHVRSDRDGETWWYDRQWVGGDRR